MKYIFVLLLAVGSRYSYSQIDTMVYEVTEKYHDDYALEGLIRKVEWYSSSFQELRSISIYEPPTFQKNTTYSVVIVTDGVAKHIAQGIEKGCRSGRIEPFLIIGIHNREPQPVDSILTGFNIDFRSREMLGDIWLTENIEAKEDSAIVKLVENRVPKYCNWIIDEVSDFIIDHYNVTAKSKWTIGGFSNGGNIVLKLSTMYPESFGNVISMSTAGWQTFNFENTQSNYFLCAGIEETNIHSRSIKIAEKIKKTGLIVEHKSFQAGHDFDMWYTYYLDCLTRIYKY